MNDKNRNILFAIICIIVIMFIISPLLFRCPFIRRLFSWFLYPLNNSGYKSSYIETFGAILGTFLAVSGSLWAQRKIDKMSFEKEFRESALVVYYDFYFAFEDIKKFLDEYFLQKGGITDKLDFEIYRKIKKRYKIYIDDNWIHNVAKLSSKLSDGEIELIYKLYGDLSTIKRSFNSTLKEKNEDSAAYSIMFYQIRNSKKIERKCANDIKVTLNDDILCIMRKLIELGGISKKSI